MKSEQLKLIISHVNELQTMNLKLEDYDKLTKDERFKNVKMKFAEHFDMWESISFDFYELTGTIEKNGLNEWFDIKLPNNHIVSWSLDRLEDYLLRSLTAEKQLASKKKREELIYYVVNKIEHTNLPCFDGFILKNHGEILEEVKIVLNFFKKVPDEIFVSTITQNKDYVIMNINFSDKSFTYYFHLTK